MDLISDTDESVFPLHLSALHYSSGTQTEYVTVQHAETQTNSVTDLEENVNCPSVVVGSETFLDTVPGIKIESDEDFSETVSATRGHQVAKPVRSTTKYSVAELARILYSYQEEGFLCDTVLVADNGQLKAHSAVLAAASPLLKSSLVLNDLATSRIIVLRGMRLHVLKIAIHFIYTGEVVIPLEHSAPDCVQLIIGTLLQLGLRVVSQPASMPAANELEHASRRERFQLLSDAQQHSTTSGDVQSTTTSCSHEINARPSIPQMSDPCHLSPVIPDANPVQSTQLLCGVGRSSLPKSVAEAPFSNRPIAAFGPTPLPMLTPIPLLPFTSITSKQWSRMVEENLPDTAPYVSNQLQSTRGITNSGCKISNCPIHDYVPGKKLCEYCGKIVDGGMRLLSHLSTHTGEKKFVCKECNKRFAYRQELRSHMLVHTGERRFLCEICNESYQRSSGLQEHRMSRHGLGPIVFPGQRTAVPKECPVCKRQFFKSCRLRQHMLSHTGEKPFACTICSRKFATKQALQWHARQHTGETPYLCGACGCSFSQPSSYYGHLTKHHGYKKKSRMPPSEFVGVTRSSMSAE